MQGFLWNGEIVIILQWRTEPEEFWQFYVYFGSMNAPAISVIFPAYNCEIFLARAIKSVLEQSFTDFEFIIINDGSTDNTEFIILSFPDSKIVYLKNEKNKGLIFSLNRGIEIARGKYIVRMDADDICLPQRFEIQKIFLDTHPETAVVASTIRFIDENGETTGFWPLDQETLNHEQIRRVMLKENCIAHPSVMGRTEIFKKYKYKDYQKNIEDYDLWLRMLSRGLRIEKIAEPLLLYRVHSNSITGVFLKNKNFYFRHAMMKWKLLWYETLSGHMNSYSFRIKWSAFPDVVKGIGKAIKNTFIK